MATKTVRDAPAQINITWTPDARRVPLESGDRRGVARAVRAAVKRCLRHVPARHPALRQILDSSASPCQLEVDMTFVTDAEIAELNTSYRNKKRPTDVLSFAQYEGAVWEDGESDDGGNAAPLLLGDIIISVETMLRQAAQQKHDLATEAVFLSVHGTLHLYGYDHDTAAARRVMWKWQEEVLELVM